MAHGETRYLMISALAYDKSELLAELFTMIANHGIRTVDLKVTVLRDHFAMLLFGACPSSSNIEACQEELTRFCAEKNVLARIEQMTSTADNGEQANIIIAGQGHDRTHEGLLNQTTQTVARVTRLIGAIEGEVVNAELEADDQKHEFNLVIRATVPCYRLDFDSLRKQLKDIGEMAGSGLDIVIRNEKALRYLYKVDMEWTNY